MEKPSCVVRHSLLFVFSCLLLVGELNAQLINNIDGNGQPPAKANNFPQAQPAQISGNVNGPAATTAAPWSSFENWLGQFKQNVVTVIDKAGNEIGNFASSASQLIQNKTGEIGKDLDGIGKPKSESVTSIASTIAPHN